MSNVFNILDQSGIIYNTTVSVQTDNITFPYLDSSRDYAYDLEFSFVNVGLLSSSLYIFFNGDNTATNYYSQEFTASDAAVSAAKSNFPRCAYSSAPSELVTGFGKIQHVKDATGTSGYIRAVIFTTRNAGASGMAFQQYTIAHVVPSSYINAIQLFTPTGSKIDVNSTARLSRI